MAPIYGLVDCRTGGAFGRGSDSAAAAEAFAVGLNRAGVELLALQLLEFGPLLVGEQRERLALSIGPNLS